MKCTKQRSYRMDTRSISCVHLSAIIKFYTIFRFLFGDLRSNQLVNHCVANWIVKHGPPHSIKIRIMHSKCHAFYFNYSLNFYRKSPWRLQKNCKWRGLLITPLRIPLIRRLYSLKGFWQFVTKDYGGQVLNKHRISIRSRSHLPHLPECLNTDRLLVLHICNE